MKWTSFALFCVALLMGCANLDDHPRSAAQAGGLFVPGLLPTGLPPLDPCEHGDDRLILVGLSFQCPACPGANGLARPETRPNPSLSTSASAPWAAQLARVPAADRYWAYRDIEVSVRAVPVGELWPFLHPSASGALNNFRYPAWHLGWYFEPNPLWMRWKFGPDDSFVTDGFDSAGRMLDGHGTYSWGSASMTRGGHQPPNESGIWHERWLLLCRTGKIAPAEILPYLDMHERYGLTPQVAIHRHASGACPVETYSCAERLVPVPGFE